jgi:hypothetical protein
MAIWTRKNGVMRKKIWVRIDDRIYVDLVVQAHVCVMTTKFSVATYFAMDAFLYIMLLCKGKSYAYYSWGLRRK